MVALNGHILPHTDLQPPGCRGSFCIVVGMWSISAHEYVIHGETLARQLGLSLQFWRNLLVIATG